MKTNNNLKNMSISKSVMLNVVLFAIMTLMFSSCKKKNDDENIINLNLSFAVDGSKLEFNSIKYVNAAANNYSVSKLHFYISAFEFENTDGSKFTFDSIFYVDAAIQTPSFALEGLPVGNYKSLRFLIGLDSLHNISHALPNTIDNENMSWPDMMGGGYHFMKLEGNFMDGGNPTGYAMHLGNNVHVVQVNIQKDFKVSDGSAALNLEMNINEWFSNPHNYNFNIDGNYSMSDSVAMSKLALNGSDVFNIQ